MVRSRHVIFNVKPLETQKVTEVPSTSKAILDRQNEVEFLLGRLCQPITSMEFLEREIRVEGETQLEGTTLQNTQVDNESREYPVLNEDREDPAVVNDDVFDDARSCTFILLN